MNPSGFEPLDTRVLILPDETEKRSAGGIILPDELNQKNQWAQTRGTLVAIGDNAFADWGQAAKPKPGDRIVYGKYAGNTHDGADGKKYTVANDEDILARWTGN